MLIDSHLHLSKEYYDDIDLIIKNANEKGVNYLIISCCTKKDLKEGLELIKKYDNIFLSIGLHPSEASIYDRHDLKLIKEYAQQNKKIIAIGEIGLDYHYGKNDIEKQKKLFMKQLELAESLNLPVVIHTRDATKNTIEILKRYNLKGVIHCFNGSVETAKEYIKMGYKLGIGGVLTFKNSNLYKVIEKIGIENIIIETDSPYLSPEPLRGSKNEPQNVRIIAEKISSITNKQINDIEFITTNNVCQLFDLKLLV